jgi:hypothetical protein
VVCGHYYTCVNRYIDVDSGTRDHSHVCLQRADQCFVSIILRLSRLPEIN